VCVCICVSVSVCGCAFVCEWRCECGQMIISKEDWPKIGQDRDESDCLTLSDLRKIEEDF